MSWSLVLKKREGYRSAFDKFRSGESRTLLQETDPELISDPEIIRNRMKIEAAVRNARAFHKIQEEFRSFDSYCWRFVEGRPKLNHWKATRQIPATSPESDAFSKDLKHRGFSFVAHGRLCAHAGGWEGKRSPHRLFPLSEDPAGLDDGDRH